MKISEMRVPTVKKKEKGKRKKICMTIQKNTRTKYLEKWTPRFFLVQESKFIGKATESGSLVELYAGMKLRASMKWIMMMKLSQSWSTSLAPLKKLGNSLGRKQILKFRSFFHI